MSLFLPVEIKVFYAWQADLRAAVTRGLIHDAAKLACDRLSVESGKQYTVVMDQATEGIPGMCDIPNVILEKIKACDVFLADLTFVGKSVNDKLVSNPNVLFELGYAAHSKGFDHILTVLNTAYGEPESQMFDIKRRWGIGFSLPEDSDPAVRAKCRDSLSKELYEALKVIISKSVLTAAVHTAEDRFARIRTEFEEKIRRNEFGQLTKLSGTMTLCVVSDRPCIVSHEQLQLPHIPPTGDFQGAELEIHGDSIQVYNGSLDRSCSLILRYNVTEVFQDGTALAADAWVLSDRPGFPRTGLPGQLVDVKFIGSVDFERLVANWLPKCAAGLRILNVPLPLRVGVSMIGINGYKFLVGSRQLSERGFAKEDLICPPVLFESAEQLASPQAVARVMKPSFDYVWRVFGHRGSMNFDADGSWITNL